MRREVIGDATLYCGDCRDVLATLAPSSVDSIVTDPPYGLKFMGKSWDHGVPGVEFWTAALRVAKPGAHLLAFGGTRTFHRLICAIEDAGWEIRDCLGWLYGSGFPKSLDVSKAIDKTRDDTEYILRVTTFLADAADRAGITRSDIDSYMGTSDMGGWWLSRLKHRCQCPKWDQWMKLKEMMHLPDDMDDEVWRLNGRKGTPGDAWVNREVVGIQRNAMSGWSMDGDTQFKDRDITVPSTEAAKEWEGWGTALKPAWEPIVLARKPLAGTVAANVLRYGTGAINVDGCRIATEDGKPEWNYPNGPGGNIGQEIFSGLKSIREEYTAPDLGRWPANILHDGSDEVVALFPAEAGGGFGVRGEENNASGINMGGKNRPTYGQTVGYGDSGSAARFFYAAKASREDRDEGLDEFDEKNAHNYRDGGRVWDIPGSHSGHKKNNHPTVKPTDLMRYLVRLVTPPGGICLDMFMGSGSTGKACKYEGFPFIGIDDGKETPIEIAVARIKYADKKASEQPDMFKVKIVEREPEREEPTLF